MAVRRCYLHVGLQKTGTSMLQQVFWDSAERLDGRVQLLPPTRAGAHRLMLAVRELLDVPPGQEPPVLSRVAALAERSAAPTALASHESMAPAGPEAIADLVHRVAPFEAHVVVTARDIARQVPSAWQQRVKTRSTEPFGEFVEAVVRRGEGARQFWLMQDLPAVLGRWADVVGRERVHLVTVPPSGTPVDVLLRRFCDVVGVDPSWLTVTTDANTAIGLPQAELLRQVNLALGSRLPRPEDGYATMGKRFLAESVLSRQEGPVARLPRAYAAWCDEVSARFRSEVEAGGYHVVGDLSDLTPQPSYFVDEPQEVPDGTLVAVAAEALAVILDERRTERQEVAELRRRLADLEATAADEMR